MSKYEDALNLMVERFGKDNLIAIATMDGNHPSVRMVDAHYEEGAFYVVTYALSNKMKQIEANHEVAVCGIDWFTASGTGENLGWVKDERNAAMMAKLREAFASWYSNGHVNEDDKNTCLLRIRLIDGIIIDHEKKYGEWQYKVDFVKGEIKEEIL
jgi:general stress protein 26